VKIEYQRAATILFYIRRSKPPSSIKMSILSNNDEDKESTHENSLQSRYSQDGKDNDNINSDTEDVDERGDVGGNSAQARIDKVRVSVISAPIELHHMIHFNILVFIISSCYSRRLNIQDRRALGVWRLE
jgi:hypothetical protein